MSKKKYFNVDDNSNWCLGFSQYVSKKIETKEVESQAKSTEYFSYEVAKQLLKQGVKVRHCNQMKQFFCFQVEDKIYDEKGIDITAVFNRWANDTFFNNNWEKASAIKQKLNIEIK